MELRVRIVGRASMQEDFAPDEFPPDRRRKIPNWNFSFLTQLLLSNDLQLLGIHIR
jgi:hypothetical protein